MDMAASNRSSVRNAPALCRGCLSSHKRMKSIFNGPYDSLFRDVANIIVSETDGLPQWICWECVSTFHRFQIFKQKLIRTNQLLYECIHRCLPFQNDNDVKEQLMQHSTSTLAISKTFTLETIPKVGRGRIVNDVEVYSSVLLRPKDLKVPEDEVSIGENCINIKPEKSEDEGVETGDWLCPVKYEDGVDYALGEADLKSEDDPDYTDPDDRPLLEKRPRRKRPRSPTYKPKKLKKIREKKTKSKHKYGPISDDDFFLQDDGAKRRTARKAIEVDPTKIRTIKLSLDKQIEQRKEDCKCGAYLKFPFKCALCFKGFNYEQKLTNHMRKHDRSRGEFECTLCSMYLPTIYSFNVHELTHSTRYECLKCGKIMIDKTSIIEHYSTVHEGVNITYVCSLCGKSSSNSKTHRGHMRNHHSGDRPKCDECGKTFVNKDSLNEHILIHTGVKNHVCEECGKRFRTKTQVKHHLLKHSEVRDFYCVECDMRFKSAHNLKQHLIKSQRHVDVDSLRYPCQRCNKRFDSERSLSHHVDFQHLGKRLHVCTTCGVALATRNSLMKHVRSAHEGYKAPLKHFCETCGKAFRARAVLIKHIRVHTGEKPYSCEHCARKFSHRSAMLTHIKLVHLKIKRFVNRSKKPAPILGRASSGHVSVSSDAPDVPTSIQTSPFAPVTATAHPIITVKQDSSLIENRRLVIIQHSIGEENAFFAANT